MIFLALAAAAFAVIHLGVSGTRLRDRIVSAVGLRSYMVMFSVVSVS